MSKAETCSMVSKKQCDYRNMPFTSEVQSKADFYTFMHVDTLRAHCDENKENIVQCRTIGILESVNGDFYLKDVNTKSNACAIKVSMAYMKVSLPSTIIPYIVQMFGTIQWLGKPVIHAKIVQVLDTALGLRLNEAITNITRVHLANKLNSSTL